MSFSSSHKDTSDTTTHTLDPQLDAAVYGNLARAQTIANTPYQPYTGQRVAGFTPDQVQAQGAYAGIAGDQTGGAPLQSAIGAAQGVAGYQPQQVSAQTVGAQPLTGVDLSGYMNPYTRSVIDSTLSDLGRQQQIQDVNDASMATKAGAFGGSRSAVLQSLDHANYARQAAQTAASLNQANFAQAQGAAQSDLARNLAAAQSNQNAGLQAATANQSAGLQAAGLNLNAAGALAGFGNDQLNQALQRAGALQTSGNAQQQNQQAQLDAAYQQWQLAQQYPFMTQQMLNQTVGTLPTNTGTTQSNGHETDTSAKFSLSGAIPGMPVNFGGA